MVDAADALVGFDEGDILKLQLDTRTDTVDGGGRPLASTKSVLTVFKNGLEQTGYENVPARARAAAASRAPKPVPHARWPCPLAAKWPTARHLTSIGHRAAQDGWHFAVGGHGAVAFEIVQPSKCAIL